MSGTLTTDEIKDIIARIVKNAKNAIDESLKDKNDEFNSGRKMAYYEVMNTIKNELIVREIDLSDTDINQNLEEMFFGGKKAGST